MTRDEGRGRVVLITGGASGIGLATAEVLVARGWRVVIGDRDVARCDAAAAAIGASSVPFDVVDETATKAAIDDIEARLGPVEALMANAGLIQGGGRPEDLPLAEFDRIIEQGHDERRLRDGGEERIRLYRRKRRAARRTKG